VAKTFQLILAGLFLFSVMLLDAELPSEWGAVYPASPILAAASEPGNILERVI
jgi:hypothetical protein